MYSYAILTSVQSIRGTGSTTRQQQHNVEAQKRQRYSENALFEIGIRQISIRRKAAAAAAQQGGTEALQGRQAKSQLQSYHSPHDWLAEASRCNTALCVRRERKRERCAALEAQVDEMSAQLRQLASLRGELASLAAANE